MKRQSKSSRMDESLGERRGKESSKSQSYASRRNESEGAKKKHESKEKKGPEKKESRGHEKFEKVMREYKHGELHSGSKKGPKVKSLSQARAIAFSEDRRADKTAKGMKYAGGRKK